MCGYETRTLSPELSGVVTLVLTCAPLAKQPKVVKALENLQAAEDVFADKVAEAVRKADSFLASSIVSVREDYKRLLAAVNTHFGSPDAELHAAAAALKNNTKLIGKVFTSNNLVTLGNLKAELALLKKVTKAQYTKLGVLIYFDRIKATLSKFKDDKEEGQKQLVEDLGGETLASSKAKVIKCLSVLRVEMCSVQLGETEEERDDEFAYAAVKEWKKARTNQAVAAAARKKKRDEKKKKQDEDSKADGGQQ